jgi:hypothetical protein
MSQESQANLRVVRSRPFRFLAAVLLVGALGCERSPTEPSSIYFLAAPSGTFENVDGKATILELRGAVDGVPSAAPLTYATAVASAPIRFNTLQNVGRHGHHTLELRIASQTESPSTYRTSNLTVELVEFCLSLHNACPVVATVSVPDQTASLSSGSAMTVSLDF